MLRETEARVACVFADLLEVRTVGADDDFFELGGDSFIAAQVALELERLFGVPVSTEVVEKISTVRSLAAWIDGRKATNDVG